MLAGVPKAAAGLGFAGLLPFAAGALGAWLLPDVSLRAYAVYAQIAYGACITSFMGAVHWGVAVARLPDTAVDGDEARTAAVQMAVSVVPALLAWSALLMTPVYALLTLIGTLAGIFLYDVAQHRIGGLPAWYLTLRKPLTLGACLFLALSLARYLAGGGAPF